MPIYAAKAGNGWGHSELDAYNIKVIHQEPKGFFGFHLPDLDQLDVSPIILNSLREPPGARGADADFFKYLEDAKRIPPDEESFVASEFIAVILKLMGYDYGRRIIHWHKVLSFVMCGQTVHARTDACLMQCGGLAECLLLVQEDKRHLSILRGEPEHQLIAGAIAAFSQNNLAREFARQKQLSHDVIPGITIVGTAPSFYKIPVSQTLVNALLTGKRPSKATIVKRLIPPVPKLWQYREQGLNSLVNRRVVLRCFAAFKSLIR